MKRGPNKPTYPFTMNRNCEQAIGLRAWWASGLTGSLSAFDSSGRNNHASLSSFATPFTRTSGWTDGLDGGRGAIMFDGTDDVVNLEASKSAAFYFGAAAAYTISFWCKIIAQPSNTHGFMAGVRVTATGNGIYIYWEKAGSRFLNGYQGLNGNYQFRYSTGSLPLNTWMHVACSRDTTNTVGGTKIAINGVDDAGTTDTTGVPDDFNPVGAPRFSYGQDYQNVSFPSACVMEDVRIYNYALSTSTKRSLYDADTRWQLRWQSNPIILSRSGALPSPGGVRPHHSRRRSLAGGFIDMGL
jgi:hypothetical protein